MYDYKMQLSDEQLNILNGSEGATMAKIMETVVMFGDIFGADKLVPITHKEGHLVTSFGIGLLDPLFTTMQKIVDDEITTVGKFTVNPRPTDYANVKCNLLEKIVFKGKIYSKQKLYEDQLERIGLKDENAFSCTCYLDEVGNIPKYGDILSWAESSAVIYANSVLGARCNRNNGMIELFGNILGLVPNFGLLKDEERVAKWKVIVRTSKLPEAQLLGSAIGMKVLSDVPYIYGLDTLLGSELNDKVCSYLKDFGAACASNGQVGLYHIDGLTPEAKEFGEKLVSEDANEYIIDDEELERIYNSYPVEWKDKNCKPNLCFIGCPHLSFSQLNEWTDNICAKLEEKQRKKVSVRTILTASPDVVEKFKESENYERLMSTGARLSSICPLMYTNNPLTRYRSIITNSNKLRAFSKTRYYYDEEVLDIITGEAKI